MTRTEYDQLPGCNFSTLKHILRSPAHYQAELAKPRDPDDDLRFAVGQLCHALILEGKNLLDLYAIKPIGMSFATKEGKAWKAEQTLPILEGDAALKIPLMAEAVAKHPLARAILQRCQRREVALQAEIEGVLLKGMLDCLGRDASGIAVLPDLKTTRDARAFKFRRKVEFELHYDFQFALYRALARECDEGECEPVWIVQEDTSPFAIMIYQPGPELRASGENKLSIAIERWKHCTETGVWPAYQEAPQIVEI